MEGGKKRMIIIPKKKIGLLPFAIFLVRTLIIPQRLGFEEEDDGVG